MIKVDQLRELIIKPALHDLVMQSDAAVELMVFTCAAETNGGEYLKQVGGPALGIYQMEPATYNDLWQNYLKTRGNLLLALVSNFDCTRMPSEDRLIYDLRFATAMARIHYFRVAAPLPATCDVDGLWRYYKQFYNTPAGRARKDEAIAKYHRLTSG